VTEILGWIATAVFVASYFFSRPAVLRAVQMGGAALWVLYGFLIGAMPVVAANVLVLTAAAWTLVRGRIAAQSP
jgi:Bacterial inner membrane protein